MDIYLNNNYQNSYIPFIQFAITGLMLLIGLMNQKKDWGMRLYKLGQISMLLNGLFYLFMSEEWKLLLAVAMFIIFKQLAKYIYRKK
jgi:hypothetical protein